MSWRKWLIRSLVLSVVVVGASALWVFQSYTNPAAMRQQVIAKLGSHFPGATITVDRASLRLLGGISVTDMRMTRRDDPDKLDFFYAPSSIIYHDKELLLQGKLAIRKIELFRPRLHVIRSSNGQWNLSDILSAVDPTKSLPTIVIHDATILFEDRHVGGDRRSGSSTPAANVVRLEIKDVDMTLLNDPLPTVLFRGKGQAELMEAVHVTGKWQRANREFVLNLEAPNIPVGLPLIQWLSAYQPALAEQARQLEGKGHLQLDLSYHPNDPKPWYHDVRWRLEQGKLRHPQLPLVLDDLSMTVHCAGNQVRLEECHARSGETEVQLRGWVRQAAVVNRRRTPATGISEVDDFMPEGADFQGEVQLTNLRLTPELFARLPDSLRDFHELYRPEGLVDVRLHFDRQSGIWKRQCLLNAKDISLNCCYFQYRLENVRGKIHHHFDASSARKHTDVNLVGHAGKLPITIRGFVTGLAPEHEVALQIQGKDIPIDDNLIKALPDAYQGLARSFHATGKGDVVASIRKAAQAHDFHNHFLVRFHDAALRYDRFPYPLRQASGVLSIQPRQGWEFRDFQGLHEGGEVRGWVRMQPTAQGDRLVWEFQGTNLPLNDDLKKALPVPVQQTWQILNPAGRVSFIAQMDVLPDQPPDLHVSVNIHEGSVRPDVIPYHLDHVSGTIHYTPHGIYLGRFDGSHGPTQLGLERGVIHLEPEGGYYVRLDGLSGNPLVPDEDLAAILPQSLRKLFEGLHFTEPFRFRTQLIVQMPATVGQPPIVFWDGGVHLYNVALRTGVPLEKVFGQVHCRGRHNGRHLEGIKGNILLQQASLFRQPLHDIHATLLVPPDAPDVLLFPNLKARLFGGEIGGAVRLEFGPTLRYDVNLTALQIKLEQFRQHNLTEESEISGDVMARLYLSGRGGDLNTLEGHGSIDVPKGRLYNLPVLFDLLKVLGLRWPDRTAFEEAHSAFAIRGQRVHVERLDLYGNPISLSGQGELNLDGSDIQLDFFAVWGRLSQILPPILRAIPPTIGQSLLKVKMRGQVGDVQFEKEPVPIVVEPLEKFIKRLRHREENQEATPTRLWPRLVRSKEERETPRPSPARKGLNFRATGADD
ncbi:MAG: AsmA-like C-terminal region-containing protein [Gemmataceae bacterium]